MSLEGKDEPCKRIQMEHKDIGTKKLSDFVTTNTRQFFVALDGPQDFLHTHPSEWKSNYGYIRGLCRVKAVKAVNDAAEHGISLIQSFNAAIANQKEQKQCLLQVVEKHHLKYTQTQRSLHLPSRTVKTLNF